MSSKQPVPLAEAITRWSIGHEGGRKRCKNFARTKDAAYIAPYVDAYQDTRGQWWLIPSGEPPLEPEVEESNNLPAPVEWAQLEHLLDTVGARLQALHEQRAEDRKLIEQQLEIIERQTDRLERLEEVVGSLRDGQPSRDQQIVQQIRETLAERKERRPWRCGSPIYQHPWGMRLYSCPCRPLEKGETRL